jgi:hypothetical protein
VFVDDEPYLRITEKLWYTVGKVKYTNLHSDSVLFTLDGYEYDTRKKVLVGQTWVEQPAKGVGFKVEFIYLDKEMYTSQDYKYLIKEMYKAKIIDANGNLIPERVEDFIRVNKEDRKY